MFKKPQDQTIDEWLADYNGIHLSNDGVVAECRHKPQSLLNIEVKPDSLFRYLDHRTTRTGSGCVALDFESVDGVILATAFFNVVLESNRGNKYPSGKRGQFIPRSRSKFMKLWKQSVGEAPSRWCRVHKSMRSHFKGLNFAGELKICIDSKGVAYNKLCNVRAV